MPRPGGGQPLPGPPAGTAEALFRAAEGALAEGKTDPAIALLEQLGREHPESALADDALYRLAQTLERSGRPQSAASVWSRLAARFPESRHARRARVRLDALLPSMERYADAFRLYQEALRSTRTTPSRELAERMEQLLAENPGFPLQDELLLWLGDELAWLEDWSAAAASYQRLLEGRPELRLEAPALGGLAECRLQLGETAAARVTLERLQALELPVPPGSVRPFLERLERLERRRDILWGAALLVVCAALVAGWRFPWRRLRRRHVAECWKELFVLVLIIGPAALLAGSESRATGRSLLLIGGLTGAVLVVVALYSQLVPVSGGRRVLRAILASAVAAGWLVLGLALAGRLEILGL